MSANGPEGAGDIGSEELASPPREAEPSSPQEAKPSSRFARTMHVVRYLLILAVVGFTIWYFSTMWDSVLPALERMNPWWVAASALVLLIGMAMNVLAWTTLLHGLGHEVPFVRSAQIMLVGQLGKYVPGSAWAYLLQMEIGRQYGVARARVLVTSLYAAGIGVVASLILGTIALPQIAQGHPELLWLFLLLPVGLACLHPWVMTALANLMLKIFRRPPLGHRVRLRTTLGALAWSLGSYLTYGVHLWLLTDGTVPLADLLLMAAALSLGFTAGLFAFLLPSGVGVREAVLIGLLGLVMAVGEASAISLVSRAMFTAGDLLTAGLAAGAAYALRRRLHKVDAATTEYADVSDA
ncbi:lysylphosphatidylglycerol synthase transmembrane domain-containing protein [Microbacterium sp. zg-YB36]|uniref:lysylphosphatidylglycerol synthase transmembrane domain-containing protein n=1 Tax=Microbacterium sp. zg-YB36 TaxID=2969407 RepID=UPI00214AB7CB|nr:lysylphosphatidylglycerol synthase transmembrane domain-containing protein [Microbacterium sp. zg-YB36]MDL5352581.1 lysylphosphatidylglycerol synthase transmembrane domain-containing protein [Microbacterium sp. zg-YB36]